jgi:hypothetical protein
MKETIEEAAERLYPAHTYWIGDGKHKALFDPYCGERISFIEGAKWQQEQMKAREIESPIVKQLLDETTPEQFNKIDKQMSNNKQSMKQEEIKNDVSVMSRLKYITDEEHLKIIDFIIDYSFKDSKEVYTNGTTLVPLFRVLDAIERKGKQYEEGGNNEQQ